MEGAGFDNKISPKDLPLFSLQVAMDQGARYNRSGNSSGVGERLGTEAIEQATTSRNPDSVVLF